MDLSLSSKFSSPSSIINQQSGPIINVTSPSTPTTSSRRKSSKPQRVIFEPSVALPPTPEDTSAESSQDVPMEISDTQPQPNKKRKGEPVPDALKDEKYRAKREKNNASAKKCRDAKKARAKEIEKQIKVLTTVLIKTQAYNEQLRNDVIRCRTVLESKGVFLDYSQFQL